MGGFLDVAVSLRRGTCTFKNFFFGRGQGFAAFGKLIRGSNNLRFDLFLDHVGHILFSLNIFSDAKMDFNPNVFLTSLFMN